MNGEQFAATISDGQLPTWATNVLNSRQLPVKYNDGQLPVTISDGQLQAVLISKLSPVETREGGVQVSSTECDGRLRDVTSGGESAVTQNSGQTSHDGQTLFVISDGQIPSAVAHINQLPSVMDNGQMSSSTNNDLVPPTSGESQVTEDTCHQGLSAASSANSVKLLIRTYASSSSSDAGVSPQVSVRVCLFIEDGVRALDYLFFWAHV